jgi:hypothetical protein
MQGRHLGILMVRLLGLVTQESDPWGTDTCVQDTFVLMVE